ncbi:nucleotidyltransferase family protein, partial [Candidatus Woesearchaeota archaeon]|nr:nucleotidyltransferase family protein [Candidatus Woesearchaeota archaeon]
AAGYATRLYPLTKDRPKHLLDVQGKPIIEHIISKIQELDDVDEIFVVTNHKYFHNFVEWAHGFEGKIPMRVYNDGTTSNEDRLGQIGDIKFVLDRAEFDDDLLIIAGDNLFNFSLRVANTKFRQNRKCLNALYDVQTAEAARQLGIATMDGGSRIVRFEEKPKNPSSTLASMGIYFFPKEKVQLLHDYIEGGNKPDKMGYFMEWLLEKDELLGHIYTEKWFDIGWHESLEQARREFRA